jgi:hypothetical protein
VYQKISGKYLMLAYSYFILPMQYLKHMLLTLLCQKGLLSYHYNLEKVVVDGNPILFSQCWNRRYIPCSEVEKVDLLVELTEVASIKVDRTPINIVLLLDRNGSMEGQPLVNYKKACYNSRRI